MASAPPSACRLILHASAAAFFEVVAPFLESREAEHGLLYGILAARIATDRAPAATAAAAVTPSAPAFFGEWRVNDQTAGVAVYLGRLLVLSHLTHEPAAALDAILTQLAQRHPQVPGVIGPMPAAEQAAAAWAARQGCAFSLVMDERIYALTTVTPPNAALAAVPGQLRVAAAAGPTAAADLERATDWFFAFEAEAVPDGPRDRAGSRAVATTRIAQQKLFFWESGGRVVAMAALARESPHGITVNAVYTPPEHRRHGYATALVAQVSAEGLRRGKRFCVLYTDLTNPTSNSIYQKIGYCPIDDARHYGFHARA